MCLGLGGSSKFEHGSAGKQVAQLPLGLSPGTLSLALGPSRRISYSVAVVLCSFEGGSQNSEQMDSSCSQIKPNKTMPNKTLNINQITQWEKYKQDQ